MNFNFFEIFFSPQCPICCTPQNTNNICHECFGKVSFLNSACRKCQEPFEYEIPGIDICNKCTQLNYDFYSQMRCPLQYNEAIKNLVVRFKNQEDFSLAKLFAKFILNTAQDIFVNEAIIIPVPLFKKRLIWRGYNQSLVLANCIAKTLKCVTVNRALLRVKDTNSQALKTIQARMDNMQGAFAIEPKYANFIKGKRCIILDDVITTGATVFECAKTLHKHGAGNIDIVSVARRLRRRTPQ